MPDLTRLWELTGCTFWGLPLDFCWNEGKVFRVSGIKDRVPLSAAHLKFAWQSLMAKEVVLLQNLAWPESRVNFLWLWGTVSDLKMILMYLFTFSCFWPSSAHIWFSTKGQFNPNTSINRLANTLYCSRYFKGTRERRCLNIIFNSW